MNISEIIFSGVLTLIIFIIIFLFLKVDKLEKNIIFSLMNILEKNSYNPQAHMSLWIIIFGL